MEKTIEIPFGAKDSELKGWEYTIPEDMEAEIKDGKIIVKQKESEDEGIRKFIIDCIDELRRANADNAKFNGRCSESIAYLERQKEQKSLNISAASEWLRKHVRRYINSEYNEFHKCVEYDGSIDKERLINDFEEAMQKELQPVEWEWPNLSNCIKNCKKCHGKCFYRKEPYEEQKPAAKPKSYDSMDDLIADALIEMVKESDLIDRDKKNRLVWIERHRKKPAEWSDSVAKEMFIKALERAVEQTKKGYELTDCDKHSWWEDFKAYSGIKPAEWSEEDELKRNNLIGLVEEIKRQPLKRLEDWDGYINFLKSLPERFNLQPKQEWSEEDKKFIKELCNLLASIAKNNYVGGYYAPDLVSKLQSLRLQPITYVLDEPLGYDNDLNPIYPPINHWKPSDEQIRPLEYAIEYFKKKKNDTTYLESLLNDLNKL